MSTGPVNGPFCNAEVVEGREGGGCHVLDYFQCHFLPVALKLLPPLPPPPSLPRSPVSTSPFVPQLHKRRDGQETGAAGRRGGGGGGHLPFKSSPSHFFFFFFCARRRISRPRACTVRGAALVKHNGPNLPCVYPAMTPPPPPPPLPNPPPPPSSGADKITLRGRGDTSSNLNCTIRA